MKRVGEHLVDESFCGSSEGKEGKRNSVETETLVPKEISMDKNGRPVSAHETAAVKATTVETIPWSTWAEKQTKRNPNNTAKLLLLMAIDSLHQNWSAPLPHCAGKKRQYHPGLEHESATGWGVGGSFVFQEDELRGDGERRRNNPSEGSNCSGILVEVGDSIERR